MKRRYLIAAAFLILCGCDILGYQLVEPTLTEDGFKKVIRKGITLEWKVEASNLTVNLHAYTEGWIAVGIDATSLMKDANVILGWVASSNVYAKDYFGVSETNYESDVERGGASDVTVNYGWETNGTRFSFTIPMNSGDTNDKVLTEGMLMKMFLSTGTDDAGTNGVDRTSYFEINL